MQVYLDNAEVVVVAALGVVNERPGLETLAAEEAATGVAGAAPKINYFVLKS